MTNRHATAQLVRQGMFFRRQQRIIGMDCLQPMQKSDVTRLALRRCRHGADKTPSCAGDLSLGPATVFHHHDIGAFQQCLHCADMFGDVLFGQGG